MSLLTEWADTVGTGAATPATPAASAPRPPSLLQKWDAETPDPQRKATNLERFLDVLSTDTYASAGAAEALLEGRNPLAGMGEGIRSKRTYGDILREKADLPDWADAAAGFALDVVLAPSTYIGFGATKIGAARKAALTAMEIANLSGDAGRIAAAERRLLEVGRLGATAADARGPRDGGHVRREARCRRSWPRPASASARRCGDRRSGRTWRRSSTWHRSWRRAARGVPGKARRDQGTVAMRAEEIAREFAPIQRRVVDLARENGIEPQKMLAAVGHAVEASGRKATAPDVDAVSAAMRDAFDAFGPDVASAVEPHTRDAITRINAINAANIAGEQGAGIPIGELQDDLGYLFHMTRPEALEAIRRDAPELAHFFEPREVTEKLKAALPREIRGRTAREINDEVRAGTMTINGVPLPALPGGLFEENPFFATSVRAKASTRAVESARMLTDWARVYGKPLAERTPDGRKIADLAVPPGWKRVPSDLPQLQDIAFPPDIAETLAAHGAAIAEPGTFMRYFDSAQGAWKAWTLGIFPVYHGRNMISDEWNATVLGGMGRGLKDGGAAALGRVNDAIRALDGWNTLRKVTHIGAPDAQYVFKLGSESYDAPTITNLAKKLGVINTGQVSEFYDVADAMRALPANIVEKGLDKLKNNAATRAGMAVGNARENATRMALFMDRIAKGDVPEQAALYVKEHLFDYNELTEFERNVMRRLFPFYSYTRKNVPLQLSYLFKKPGALLGFQKAREELAGDQPLGIEGAQLPRFLREGLPVRMGANAEGRPQYLRTEGYLPLGDVQLPMDPLYAAQRATNMLSPFIGTPLEMLLNVDLFKSDIPSGKLERLEDFPGEETSLLGVPVSRRWVNTPARDVRLISELDKANPFGIFGDEEGGPMGTPRAYPDPSAVARLANLGIGRVYAVDPEQEQRRQRGAAKREISRLKGELSRARKRGDDRNARRIEKQIERLRESPESFAR